MSQISIAPEPNILQSFASRKHSMRIALAELIDNALDQQAKTVSIECGADYIVIEDDGNGCDAPKVMVTLGSHHKTATTKLGRFGIGGKDAALWLGGMNSTITIRTVHGGYVRELRVNWREVESNNWNIDAPVVRKAGPSDVGTRIRISPVQRHLPKGDKWRDLIGDLSYLFFAALKMGCQIKFKRAHAGARWEPLVRWELPVFDGPHISERIVVNGRGATVTCGVVKPGVENPHAGFTYTHEWRVIEESTANGCGNHSPGHICGLVELDKSWPLSTNKDEIGSGVAVDLYAEVERACRDVLIRGDRAASELRSSAFESDVSELLNNLLSADKAKAVRRSGGRRGSKQPKHTGIRHTRATVEQSGETFPSRRGGSYRIEFATLGASKGSGKLSVPSTVLLNDSIPAIDACKREQNRWAIVMLALAHVAYAQSDSPPEAPLLKGTPAEFSLALGSILSAADLSLDGSRIVKPNEYLEQQNAASSQSEVTH